MNRAQQQLVWSGAAFALMLGILAANELAKPGVSCKEKLEGWVDGRGRWVQAKSRICE